MPSHRGHRFHPAAEESLSHLAGTLEPTRHLHMKKNFLRRKLKYPGICLYLPLPETAFATWEQRESS